MKNPLPKIRLPRLRTASREITLVILAIFLFSVPLLRGGLWLPQPPDEKSPRERSLQFSVEHDDLAIPFRMARIPIFNIPERTCAIEQYGAIGDGTTSNTKAFASAISDCAQKGGGTVTVPEGKWVTGTIRLKSDIRLDLAKGAEIIGSESPEEYLPVVFSRFEGMDYYNYASLIYARNATNVAITGSGSINGRGAAWWGWRDRSRTAASELYRLADRGVPARERTFGTETAGLRPSLVSFVDCSSVHISGITMENGPMWTLHLLYSENIAVDNVNIHTEGPNNDGIVIDSSKNVSVSGATLDTEDDAIAIKSGLDRDGQRVGKSSENIIIRDCKVGRGNGGVVIGSEMSGDVRNVFISDCSFNGTKRGLRVKSLPGRSGIVENVFAERIEMRNIEQEAVSVNMEYDSKSVINPPAKNPPVFRNFSFKDISVTNARVAILINGLSESPVQGTRFENFRATTKFGVILNQADNISFQTIDLRALRQPLIFLSDTRHASFDTLKRKPSYRPFVIIDGPRSKDILFPEDFSPRSIRLLENAAKDAYSINESAGD